MSDKLPNNQLNNNPTAKVMKGAFSTPTKGGGPPVPIAAHLLDDVVMGGTTPYALAKRQEQEINLKRPRPTDNDDDPFSTGMITDDWNKQNIQNKSIHAPLAIRTKNSKPLPAAEETTFKNSPDATTEADVSSVNNTACIDFARSTTPTGKPTPTVGPASTLPASTAPPLFNPQVPSHAQQQKNNGNQIHPFDIPKTLKAPIPLRPSGAARAASSPQCSNVVFKTNKNKNNSNDATDASSPAAAGALRIAALESQLALSERAQELGMDKIRELLAEVKAAKNARAEAEAGAAAAVEAAVREKNDLLKQAEQLIAMADENERGLWGAVHRRDAKVANLTAELESLKSEKANAIPDELKALREENAALKKKDAEARAAEEKRVAEFESIRDYCTDLEKQATQSEQLAAKVHQLGQEQFDRAEALEELCHKERESRDEAVKWGMKWQRLAERRKNELAGRPVAAAGSGSGDDGSSSDAATRVKENVIDRMYNTLHDIIGEARTNTEVVRAQLEQYGSTGAAQPPGSQMPPAPGSEE
ncbi:hypothetical protein UCDDS831_g02484 [Diplodia seriata]|uniref:Uncharacterized protein n=1 Tax=Diplodia seriata TaxID=420778 RepID=A0A0G2ENG3_9PEZI|nr:hypothetical protein UCDDS831_g02484 [Diplodia seriata]